MPFSTKHNALPRLLGLFGTLTAVAAFAAAARPQTPPAPAAIIRINPSHTYQTIAGFGAATAYYQNWITAHPEKETLYRLFFKDLNLSILRLQNTYRPDKKAGFAKDDADIVRGANTALGHPIRILMSSWSPPAGVKSNGSEKGGGTLAQVNGAFVYEKFADYWADSVAAYRKVGIDPSWVCLQNEPDWKADYESCLLKPHETTENGIAYAGYDKTLDAVTHRFRSVAHPPLILGPEPLGIGGNSVQNYLGAENSPEVKQLYGIAHHLYYGGDHRLPDSFAPALHGLRDTYPNKPKWMTEFGRSDGFQTAWCIHECLTEENAAAYVYWAGLWPGKDTLIDLDNIFQPKATWKYPHGFSLNDRYFGLKHFSAFIEPGYQRVEATATQADLRVSAFAPPNRGRLVWVALNTSNTETIALRVAPVSGFGGKTAVYRSVLPPPAVAPTDNDHVGVNGAGERWHDLGAVPPSRTLSLPPHSIVTVVMDRIDRGK